MAIRKRVSKNGSKAGGAGNLKLLDEIEGTVEASVRALLKSGKLSVSDLLKLREIVREILAERPHKVVVRWVDPCELEAEEQTDGMTSELTEKEPKGEPSGKSSET